MRQFIIFLLLLISNSLLGQEKFMFLINRYRTSNGSPTISFSPELSELAKRHNTILVEQDTFYHSHYGSAEIMTRGENWMFDSSSYVETNNFFVKYFGKKLACPQTEDELREIIYIKVLKNFHESPPHKRNLLSGNYKKLGFDLSIRDLEIVNIGNKKSQCFCKVKYCCVIIFE